MQKHRRQKKPVAGIAWYRPEQWKRLREVSVDLENLEDTHAEWLAFATKTFRDMQGHGVSPVKVDVDVEELVTWCQERRLPINAYARAQFAVHKLQQTAGLRPKPAKAN